MHQLQQVRQFVRLQRQIDGVHRLAAKRRVHHDRRERALDRVAGNAIDLGGSIHLIDAIGIDQRPRCDLPRPCLFARRSRGKGKRATRAHTQHARDDSGVAHADADDVGVVRHALKKADERDIVGQRLGGRDDLDEVWLERLDALVDAVEVLRCGEVVMADDQRHARIAKLLQFSLLQRLDGLKLKIDEVKSCCAGLGENLDLSSQ